MPINDPVIAAFVDEFVRPASDRALGLKLVIDVKKPIWDDSIITRAAWTAAAGTDVVRSRADDARSPVTKNDIINAMNWLLNYKTMVDGGGDITAAAGVQDIFARVSVNPRMFGAQG
jgi:hypothetical protein